VLIPAAVALAAVGVPGAASYRSVVRSEAQPSTTSAPAGVGEPAAAPGSSSTASEPAATSGPPSTSPTPIASEETTTAGSPVSPASPSVTVAVLEGAWRDTVLAAEPLASLVCPRERQLAAALQSGLVGDDVARALDDPVRLAIAAFDAYAAGDLAAFAALGEDVAGSYAALRAPPDYVLLRYASALGGAAFGALPCGEGGGYLVDPYPLYGLADPDSFTRYLEGPLSADPDLATRELREALDGLARAAAAVGHPSWAAVLNARQAEAHRILAEGAAAWAEFRLEPPAQPLRSARRRSGRPAASLPRPWGGRSQPCAADHPARSKSSVMSPGPFTWAPCATRSVPGANAVKVQAPATT